jgi:predicted TIM-barrel fold metal-dependent hydrolase
MRIIDVHTHVGPGGAIIASVDKLLRSMDAAGIDTALAFAGRINDCDNAWLLREITAHRDRIVAVGSVSPLHEEIDLKQLEDLLGTGTLAALKFYVGYEHYFPTDPALRPVLELLSRLGRPAIFHSGDLYDKVDGAEIAYAHPDRVGELAALLPELTIMIAHMGWPYVRETAHVCAKHPNVVTDTSGFVYDHFDEEDHTRFAECLALFESITGSRDQLLFGSDWPICDQHGYIAAMRRAFGGASEQLFQRTAQRVFQI